MPQASHLKRAEPAWDARWDHVLDGLRVLLFHSQKHGQETGEWFYYGEVTGVVHHDVFVVVDGEDEPRRFHWTQVRPA